MLFQNKDFKAMESSLAALNIQKQVIAHNISNYSTPGYKTKSVEFEEVLKTVTVNGKEKQVSGFQAVIKTDGSTTERLDGNNVNLEQEQLALWQTYAQHSYLVQRVNGKFNNMRYVINQAMK